MGGQMGDAEASWQQTCLQQGWDDASKIIHLEGFLRERGVFAEFAVYAKAAADEENGDRRAVALEELGYSFKEDSDQPGMWVWIAPTDACDMSFSSKSQAVEAAWADATHQAKEILQMTGLEWEKLEVESQIDLVERALGE